MGEHSNKVEYWLDLANYDLTSAKAMQKSKLYLYVGFMCHQTIEKALKAVIAKTGELPKRTHNLAELAKDANMFIALNDKQKMLLATLQPLNIQARYPEYKQHLLSTLSHKVCDNLIKDTEEFFIWIKTQL